MKAMKVVTVGCLNDEVLKNLILYMYKQHLDFLKGLDSEQAQRMLLLDSCATFGVEKAMKILSECNFDNDSHEAKNFLVELSKSYINTIVSLNNSKFIKLCNMPNMTGKIRTLSMSDFGKFDRDMIICGEDNLPIEMEIDE